MLNIDWTPALATRVAALMHITTANDIAKIDHVVTFYQNVFFPARLRQVSLWVLTTYSDPHTSFTGV